jgi:hypothetical protein
VKPIAIATRLGLVLSPPSSRVAIAIDFTCQYNCLVLSPPSSLIAIAIGFTCLYNCLVLSPPSSLLLLDLMGEKEPDSYTDR